MAGLALPAVIDALVAVLRAAPGLAGVPVFDGPDEPMGAAPVVIGVGDTRLLDDGDVRGGNAEVSWAGLGAYGRDEQGWVPVAIDCVTGVEGDLSALRGLAKDTYLVVEQALFADRTLGGLVTTQMEIVSPAYHYLNEDGGPHVVLTFQVHYETTI